MPDIAVMNMEMTIEAACASHGNVKFKGKIVSGSNITSVNGNPIARQGDRVKLLCGHYGEIVSKCSEILNDEGKPVAIVGSIVQKGVTGNAVMNGFVIKGDPTISIER